VALEEKNITMDYESNLLFMDTSNLYDKKREYFNLMRDQILAQKWMMTYGGMNFMGGMGAPMGGYGGMGGIGGMSGMGGMSSMGDISGYGGMGGIGAISGTGAPPGDSWLPW
jgi:hypothetical protein